MKKVAYNVCRTGFTMSDNDAHLSMGVHHFEIINVNGTGTGEFINIPGHKRAFTASQRYLITVEEV